MTEDTAPLPFPDFTGQGRLYARDLQAELDAQIASQNAYDRSLRAWGVVRGLAVRIGADPSQVDIEAGVALDGCGNVLTVDETRSVSIAEVFQPQAWIVLSVQDRPAGWRMFPAASGHTRIERDIVLEAIGRPPADPSLQIVLARVSIGTDQQIAALDPGSRRGSELSVGRLSFPRPAMAESLWPAVEPGDEAGSLHLRAPQVDLFGSAGGPLSLRIGPVDPGNTARLAIRAPDRTPFASRISNSDDIVYSAETGGLSSLSVGDTLFVDAAYNQDPGVRDGLPDNGVQTLAVTEISTPDTVRAGRNPDLDFLNAPFEVRRINILHVRDARGRTALVARLDERVGIGTSSPSATLAVSGGDLEIASGSGSPQPYLCFLSTGMVESDGGDHAIGLPEGGASLCLRSSDDLAVFIGETGPDTDPAMLLNRSGRVGIGTAAPVYTLSVNGTVKASQGLVFPDGTIQTKGVVPIPVGTIVDWWHPAGTAEFDVEGFQICNGSTITDPDSPLKGQTTPALAGVLVRGVTDFNEIGKTGGSATHTHAFTASDHTHPMPHTHQVKGTTAATSSTAGDDIAGGTVAHLHHVHNFNLTSSGPDPADTGTNNQPLAGTSGPGSSLPMHMFALKVMRIK